MPSVIIYVRGNGMNPGYCAPGDVIRFVAEPLNDYGNFLFTLHTLIILIFYVYVDTGAVKVIDVYGLTIGRVQSERIKCPFNK